ncbi:MAG: MerC domain-containing protein [bacterium]
MTYRRPAARFWDVCAAALSSACLLHCLAFPLLITLAPVTWAMLDNHTTHLVLVALAIPVTCRVAWSEGFSGDGAWFTPIALCGLSTMVLAVTIFETYEVLLTVLGATLLASAHVLRWFRHQPRSSRLVIRDDP